MSDISVQELKQKIDNKETFLLIDVREVWESEEFNIGGELVPLGELPSGLDQYADWKSKEVIVYCKTGGRSAAAKDYMKKQGFSTVRNLLGGVTEWQDKFL